MNLEDFDKYLDIHGREYEDSLLETLARLERTARKIIRFKLIEPSPENIRTIRDQILIRMVNRLGDEIGKSQYEYSVKPSSFGGRIVPHLETDFRRSCRLGRSLLFDLHEANHILKNIGKSKVIDLSPRNRRIIRYIVYQFMCEFIELELGKERFVHSVRNTKKCVTLNESIGETLSVGIELDFLNYSSVIGRLEQFLVAVDKDIEKFFQNEQETPGDRILLRDILLNECLQPIKRGVEDSRVFLAD